MTGWAEGPLAGFDLETTGTDPETARIVTACYAVHRPGEAPGALTVLADPGVEIPEEATAIHGITTAYARAEGLHAEAVARWVLSQLEGVPFDPMPLVVYNAPYDLTVAEREGRRHGLIPVVIDGETAYWPFLPDVRVIDPLVLDKALDRYRRGSRKLADVCRHYGITLEDAHDAKADTLAAIALARALAEAYPEIAIMTGAELHEFQVKAKGEQAASLQDYLRRKGSDEIIDPSWPMVPWSAPEPEPVAVPHPAAARERLLRAALRCLSAGLAEEHADADAEAEYADEMLALAARELVAATNALPADRQPVGWDS